MNQSTILRVNQSIGFLIHIVCCEHLNKLWIVNNKEGGGEEGDKGRGKVIQM